MIRFSSRLDDRAWREWEIGLESSVEQLHRSVNDSMRVIRSIGLDALTEEPGHVIHPFEFATPRSRRKYFHLLSLGLIPTDGHSYLRQHETANAWFAYHSPSSSGGEIVFENPKAHSIYVYWPRQVPGHTITGWPQLPQVTQEIAPPIFTAIIESWVDLL